MDKTALRSTDPFVTIEATIGPKARLRSGDYDETDLVLRVCTPNDPFDGSPYRAALIVAALVLDTVMRDGTAGHPAVEYVDEAFCDVLIEHTDIELANTLRLKLSTLNLCKRTAEILAQIEKGQ